MKNILKKSIIFAVIALSMLAFLVFSASAEDDGIDDSIYYCREALGKLPNSEALIYAYDCLVAGVDNVQKYISVNDGTYILSNDEMHTVVDAYRRDYAHHFWIANEYTLSNNGETVTKIMMNYIMSETDIAAKRAEFEAAADEILAGLDPSMTDFEKELYLHDLLASNTVYDLDAANAHNSYGAIVEGKAVCEGYAEALQYLLHRAKIRSFIVIGYGINEQGAVAHAWNCIEIGGKFSHTDLTWDDQGDIYYGYFNVKDSTIKEDHIITETKYPLPVCDSDEYMYFKVKGGYLDTYNKDLLAAILRNGTLDGDTLSAHVYIPGDVNEFWSWYSSNIAYIAGKTGAVGTLSYGASQLHRELVLVLVGDFSGDVTLPAAVTSASVSLGSDLTMNFYITLEDASDLAPEDFSLSVTMCGKTEEITEYSIVDGKYVFSFGGISPQQMTDLIDFTLYSKKVKLWEKTGYTVRENAQTLLNKYPTDKKLVDLLSDMLRYGDAAQKFLGYRLDDLATEGVTGMSEAHDRVIDSTDKKAVFENTADDVYFTYAGVWFDNVNKLYVKISSTDGAKVIIKAGGEVVATHYELESTTVYTNAVSAADFGTVYTFELYDNEVLTETLTYSVNSYCYSMQNKADTGELAEALYNYGCSAAEYGK